MEDAAISVFQVQMELSVSAHTKAAGIWPTITSTAWWTQVPAVISYSSPASMGVASLRNGNVTMTMTVVMAVMSCPQFVPFTRAHQQPSLVAMDDVCHTTIAVIITMTVGTTAMRQDACSGTATAPQSSLAAMGGAFLSVMSAMV